MRYVFRFYCCVILKKMKKKVLTVVWNREIGNVEVSVHISFVEIGGSRFLCSFSWV